MLTRSIKSFIVFVFLFAILERTGLDMVSWISGSVLAIGMESDAEKPSKESEKEEDKVSKDFWFSTARFSYTKILATSSNSTPESFNSNSLIAFYSSIPTPPPDNLYV